MHRGRVSPAGHGVRLLAARRLIRDFASAQCRVFSFGAVPWAKQQKTRVNVYTVHAGSAEKLKLFGLSQQLFQVRRVKPKNADPFWDVPQVPDLIARNLTSGRPWHVELKVKEREEGIRE
jgi:hypothetical protein